MRFTDLVGYSGTTVDPIRIFLSKKMTFVREAVKTGNGSVLANYREIPLVAKKTAEAGTYHAVICLGAVIRGATPHFDYVSAEVSKGIAAVGMDSSIPVIFGVITTDTIEQAIERAGTKAGNKGWSAAVSAVEMANLIDVLNK